ncbi:MAG TPA: hypothetical protein VE869_06095, partial [Gemmatimonas sp.]|nr:hypothetical protein [Gemmatimonas sp.]
MTTVEVEVDDRAPRAPTSQPQVDDGYHEEPPYVRPVPTMRFGVAAIVAMLVFVCGLAAWETYWRSTGAPPGYLNSDGLWAMQRRRIDQGEGSATVLIGSSRMLFDLQPAVWERLDGRRPIQLSLEGTSPLPFLEDLAADTAFKGRLLVGVTPGLFFNNRTAGRREKALTYPQKETPSQRSGQWLSMTLLEPRFAFLDADFALFTVLKRQTWPP